MLLPGVWSENSGYLGVSSAYMSSIKSKKWVYVTLKEGKNRELRKIFTYLGYTIDQLVRLRVGSIELGNLKEGHFRQLAKGEIAQLLEGNR